MNAFTFAASTSIRSEATQAGPWVLIGAAVLVAVVLFVVRVLISHDQHDDTRP